MKYNNGICRKVRGTLMLYKRKWEVSGITAGGLFLLLVAIKSQMLVTDEYMGSGIAGYQTVSLISYVLLTLLICAVILWAGPIKNKKPAKILAVLTLCIMPAVSFFMFEMVAGNFLQSCIIRLGWYC